MSSELIEFMTITCVECGVLFGVTTRHFNQVHRVDGEMQCPNGHGNLWEGEQEKEKVKGLESELEAMRDRYRRAMREVMDLKGCIASLRHYQEQAEAVDETSEKRPRKVSGQKKCEA